MNKLFEQFYITENDFGNIRAISKTVINNLDDFLDDLYEWFIHKSTFGKVLTTDTIIQGHRTSFKKNLTDLFSLNFNENYLNSMSAIAHGHIRLGLSLSDYFERTSTIKNLFEVFFQKLGIFSIGLSQSFHKFMDMEISLVSTAYSSTLNHSLQEQNEVLKDIAAPVSQLWKGLLFIPIVGRIDEKRIQNIQTLVLNRVMEKSAKVLILDISGIQDIDQGALDALFKITSSVKLMGCKSIISGISSEIATLIIEAGIKVDQLITTGNLEDALQKGFEFNLVKVTAI